MAKTYSCILVGIDVHIIEIETVLGSGFSGLNILGLPTDATRDMRERVRSALESIDIPIPARRVVVNISSNELIKLSRTCLSQLDFAVAACIIHALFDSNDVKIPLYRPEQEFFAGELSLSGELKPINNPLIYEAIYAQQRSKATICLSYNENYHYQEFEYYKHLHTWLEHRKKVKIVQKIPDKNLISSADNISYKINEDKLNAAISTIEILLKNPKIAVSLLIAAAGRHNILIAGEPGIGKSFALKKYPHLLCPLTEKEKIEVKLIHSNMDVLGKPFRSPHHSTTSAALVGGSSLKPGEVTLAHNGVLFLDELAEFPRSSLEALREPLDSEYVTLSRAKGNIVYPAKFQLCATTNPCPCGYRYSRKKACRCNPTEQAKYLQKISGPLLDRFCLQIWIDSTSVENKPDIFGQYLLNIRQKLKQFVEHFFQIQQQLSLELPQITNTQIACDFSLRGQEKIKAIAHTFVKLFPTLRSASEFNDAILTYRSLSTLFSRNY